MKRRNTLRSILTAFISEPSRPKINRGFRAHTPHPNSRDQLSLHPFCDNIKQHPVLRELHVALFTHQTPYHIPRAESLSVSQPCAGLNVFLPVVAVVGPGT